MIVFWMLNNHLTFTTSLTYDDVLQYFLPFSSKNCKDALWISWIWTYNRDTFNDHIIHLTIAVAHLMAVVKTVGSLLNNCMIQLMTVTKMIIKSSKLTYNHSNLQIKFWTQLWSEVEDQKEKKVKKKTNKDGVLSCKQTFFLLSKMQR